MPITAAALATTSVVIRWLVIALVFCLEVELVVLFFGVELVGSTPGSL
jgi:hypothetical protein